MQPGLPNLQRIVQQAQQMQAEMERAQAALAEAEVTGHAGGGLVTATVTGDGQLRRVRIDPSVVDPSDIETLEDLVVAAVHDARRSADDMSGSRISEVAGGLAGSLDLSALGLPGLPGLDFPGLGPGPRFPDDDTDDGLEDDDEFEADDDDDDEDDDDDDDDDDEVIVVEDASSTPPPGTPSTDPPGAGVRPAAGS